MKTLLITLASLVLSSVFIANAALANTDVLSGFNTTQGINWNCGMYCS